jgi:RHS repeat-associated protein
VVAISTSGGAASSINAYDEYGIPARTNASIAAGGRFQYTGQVWLPEIGLYYYKARMYSPTLGRFMQTDPIGYKDGINWYDYVDGDPVNRVDPTGLLQDSFELATQRDDQALLRGEITPEEYRERQQARGAGGVIGGALVLGGLAAAKAAPIVVIGGRTLGQKIGGFFRGLFGGGGKITIQAADATLPQGMSRAQFGNLVGFKQGLEASAAASTKVGQGTISALKDAGVTKQAIKTFQKFYQGVAKANPENLSAAHRAKLLKDILKNW